ncbi:Zinc finger, RING-type [Corchorus capsularis]|uniref:RING-type E3 ubiquitin transferase n=1 Tax=Corchorus capsularis TaxID=210143 RepID=A0A1R3GRL6_COCAP|nr:Zinc finger, RING-type [Corchorus capsularis]
MATVSVFRCENMHPNIIIPQPPLNISSNYPPAPTSEVQLDLTMSFSLKYFSRHSSYTVGRPSPYFKSVRCSIDNPALASWNLDCMLLDLFDQLHTDFNFIAFEDNSFFMKVDHALDQILQHWNWVRMTNFYTSSRGNKVFPVHAVFSGAVVEYVQQIIPPVVQQVYWNYDLDSTVMYDEVGIGTGRAVQESVDSTEIYDEVGIGIGRAVEESALELERRRYYDEDSTEIYEIYDEVGIESLVEESVERRRYYDEDSTEIHDEADGMGSAVEESSLEFERRRYGMVPATESSIKGMLKSVVNGEQGKDCMVCLEELEVGSYISEMPCSHAFHGDCIQTWLKQSHYCPICRFEMPTATEEEFN